MKLTYLPNELLHIITSYLPRQSISRLSLTCTQSYQVFLPLLYRHIELGHRTQIRQLEQGLTRNAFLRETVQEYTQILTLKCRQGGNSHWLIISLFEQLPNIKQLYFRDFLSLSISKVGQALAALPHLKYLDFQYCNLIMSNEKEQENPSKHMLYNLTDLNLTWTDFSVEAIRQLFMTTPNLTRVVLGANHNRKLKANDGALKVLAESCHQVKSLSISLQQVKEDVMCQVVQKYGPQLEHLSIRCEGSEIIKTISQYTTRLQHLIIRCNYSGDNNVMHILQQCKALNHLEMVSWPLQDVPTIVLDQLRYRQLHPIHPPSLSSSSITAPTSSYIEGIKRTVALNGQDLQEIRRLCLYQKVE